MDKDPLTLLRKHLGYPAFRPGQEQLVRAVLNGRDAVGILPTGGGKSVCCQIPALALGGLTLVVTPLISLMEDQVRRAREVGLRAAHLSASQPADERRQTAARVRMGGLDVLFIAPERLEQEAFTTLLAQADIRLVAIDEAHCISEWGHDFRPSYRLIDRIRAHVDCPLVALTATATPAVRLDVVRSLALTDPKLVVQSFDRPNLAWRVEGMSPQASRLNRIHQLLGRHRGTTIVYAPTRRTVEDVRDGLARRGHRCEVYHAGMSGSERTRVLQAFLADECRVVVATNAFGMGNRQAGRATRRPPATSVDARGVLPGGGARRPGWTARDVRRPLRSGRSRDRAHVHRHHASTTPSAPRGSAALATHLQRGAAPRI